MKRILLSAFLLLNLISCATGEKKSIELTEGGSPQKIITAGGTITEIVYSLGFGDQIIATDRTSTYPKEMQALPSIGYRNQIKSEGILSLSPDMVLVEEGYLSEEVVSQLKLMDLKIHFFKKPTNPDETKNLVRELARLFEVPDTGEQINENINKDLKRLEAYLLKEQRDSLTAAFVMARGPETLFIAGENTFAEEIFNLAGIKLAAKGFKEFIPLTPESLVSMSPDYLVLFDSGLESLGGLEGLAAVNGVKETEAFREKQVLSFEGHYLSGMGPRVGQVALELAKSVREK
ncbi:heme/hemin ABC transporter substrate-binding protein [Cyclobacterium marinum]|uniref:heme/hemin ABC transporter substrate-binding protein n=1 Tax=Cyclobacterium marinum TaxID=104 RepID=UPI0011EF96A3|nr:ABC transporter substrate-binding protein [Cyclobacterium marinum]MBI0399343.1 ABC transporter substrate-binding protein [Cyclobacterium marinum]|tara:strand:- start:69858 stop:70730 length:873 start_codon:yes stop_codon:yes gene_type:complete